MTPRSDDGFSLIELVMAMFLFGLIALAILPSAISAAELSVVNRDHVAANAFASGQLALVRSDFPDTGDNACTAVQAHTQMTPRVEDPAKTGLEAEIVVSPTCPTFPGVVDATVKVFDPEVSGTAPVVTMSTKIVVTK